MCSICQQFLTDFVQAGLPKEVPMASLMRLKNLSSVTPDLVHWYMSLSQEIPQRDFDDARETASRIAQRGRGAIEYEILINTSTFNLLRHKIPSLQTDLELLKVLLVEAGVFEQKKDWKWCLQMAQGYLIYSMPRTLLLLQEIHRDHSITKIGRDGLIAVWKSDDEGSCADTDDYQKEILNDPTYGDWYD